MAYGFLDIALTPSVKTVQEQMNADRIWSDFRGHRAFDRFSDNVAGYIAERDSFYIATVSETGWLLRAIPRRPAWFSESARRAHRSRSPTTAATGNTSAPAMSAPMTAPACC